MRVFFFILLLLVVGAGVGIAVLPLSIPANYLAKRVPDLTFATATGNVWNGRLNQLVYSGQSIGDVQFKLLPGELLRGRAGASLSLVRSDLSGEGRVSHMLGSERVVLEDLKLSGNTTALAGLPLQIRALDGEFRMALNELSVDRGKCERASGNVWSDMLTRAERQWLWTGPELSGAVTCDGGVLRIDAAGNSLTGDEVSAEIRLGVNLKGSLVARVRPAQPGAADSLSRVGFRQEGDLQVLQTRIGDR